MWHSVQNLFVPDSWYCQIQITRLIMFFIFLPFWHPPALEDGEVGVGEDQVHGDLRHPHPQLSGTSVAPVLHLEYSTYS